MILRELDNENIPKLYEVYEDNNDFFLILEYVNGKTLIDYMRTKGKMLNEEESLIILKSILKSLVYLHEEKGIMHRDLKPENIMICIDENGVSNAKLLDFGLSEKVSSSEYIHVRCGTPGFVAPEIVNAKPGSDHYSSVCDVFSLGIVFHLM